MRDVGKLLGRRALSPLLGRVRLQPFWEAVYEVALAGQNVGEGNHPRHSGERVVLDVIRRQVGGRSRPVLFDVGANRGQYAQLLLEAFGDSADVWCFEPSPSAYRLLAQAIGDNRSVKLYNLGFSEEPGDATLYVAGEASKLGSLHDTRNRFERLGLATDLKERVTLTTVDEFLVAQNVELVDFLKLDVEGHELQVLEGAAEALTDGRIGAIQFEFSAANLDSRTYFRDFYELLTPRYHLYRVLRDGLRRIERYRETLELFKRATNYLALPYD